MLSIVFRASSPSELLAKSQVNSACNFINRSFSLNSETTNHVVLLFEEEIKIVVNIITRTPIKIPRPINSFLFMFYICFFNLKIYLLFLTPIFLQYLFIGHLEHHGETGWQISLPN